MDWSAWRLNFAKFSIPPPRTCGLWPATRLEICMRAAGLTPSCTGSPRAAKRRRSLNSTPWKSTPSPSTARTRYSSPPTRMAKSIKFRPLENLKSFTILRPSTSGRWRSTARAICWWLPGTREKSIASLRTAKAACSFAARRPMPARWPWTRRTTSL